VLQSRLRQWTGCSTLAAVTDHSRGGELAHNTHLVDRLQRSCVGCFACAFCGIVGWGASNGLKGGFVAGSLQRQLLTTLRVLSTTRPAGWPPIGRLCCCRDRSAWVCVALHLVEVCLIDVPVQQAKSLCRRFGVDRPSGGLVATQSMSLGRQTGAGVYKDRQAHACLTATAPSDATLISLPVGFCGSEVARLISWIGVHAS
jgi:hypothetical protein